MILSTADESNQPSVYIDLQVPEIHVSVVPSYIEIPLRIPVDVVQWGTLKFILTIQSLDTVTWSAPSDGVMNHVPSGDLASAVAFMVSVFNTSIIFTSV